MISLTPEAVEYLTTNYPFLVQEDLPAGTYPNNIDYDVTCVAVKAVLVASEDLGPRTSVYELLTQMFENQESMAATQAKFQFLTLENAVAGVGDVPMHPGARSSIPRRVSCEGGPTSPHGPPSQVPVTSDTGI